MQLNVAPTTRRGGSLGSNRLREAEPSRAADSEIRLSLPARPENVAVVRHVIGALAQALAMPPRLVEDIRLAVTEACTNVVRHAYRDGDGPLEVEIRPDRARLLVVVADRGQGIAPNPGAGGPGLGLPLMAALAESVEIDQSPESGSRVRMAFRASRSLEAA